MYVAARHDNWSEFQADSEFPELNGYRVDTVARLHNGEGKFTSCQKACFFAIDRDQVGFSQDLQQILLLQCFNDRADVDVRASHKNIEKVADIYRGRRYRRGGDAPGCTCGRCRASGCNAPKLPCLGLCNSVPQSWGKEIDPKLSRRRAIHFRELHFK